MAREVCIQANCPVRQVRLQDGTWANICPAGVIGGCDGPNASELEVLDATSGRMNGQSPQTPPLIFEDGKSIVRGWRNGTHLAVWKNGSALRRQPDTGITFEEDSI